ncbi:MAG: hypothetical protein ACREL7_17075 [Longimicrobiales bacterium]
MKRSNSPARTGHAAKTDAVYADFERIRDLLARAAMPPGGDQRTRFLDVLAELDAFTNRHPEVRLDEVSAIRQITLRALEID